MTTLATDTAQNLLKKAQEAARHAYAPYSDFPVGAAILSADGSVYTGCNVENVVNGLSVCAERSAVSRAVSDGCLSDRNQGFQAIAVWAEKSPYGAVTPCGACRQVLWEFCHEFGSPAMPVVMTDPKTGAIRQIRLSELLPQAFGKD